jgi:hypothetical protein
MFCAIVRQSPALLPPKRKSPMAATFEIGVDHATGGGTMEQVSKESKPFKRGSLLTCLRSVAAAGSLLNYWTDFGRLFT